MYRHLSRLRIRYPERCLSRLHDDTMTTPPLPIAPLIETARPAAGRRAVIAREELIDAALALLGPDRSVSSLGLREIAREAGIAPNSFYRHFPDTDALAIALIERSGSTLRRIFSEARQRASQEDSVVRTAVTVFMEQLNADEGYLPLLLREGKVGSKGFKEGVEKQLRFFEDELQNDLVRLAERRGQPLQEPALVARAITRLVFTMGALALDESREEQAILQEQTITMIRMLLAGAQKGAQR